MPGWRGPGRRGLGPAIAVTLLLIASSAADAAETFVMDTDKKTISVIDPANDAVRDTIAVS